MTIIPLFYKIFGSIFSPKVSFIIINSRRGSLRYREQPYNITQYSTSSCLSLLHELVKLHEFNEQFMNLTSKEHIQLLLISMCFSGLQKVKLLRNVEISKGQPPWIHIIAEQEFPQCSLYRNCLRLHTEGYSTVSSLLYLLLGSQFKWTFSSFVPL